MLSRLMVCSASVSGSSVNVFSKSWSCFCRISAMTEASFAKLMMPNLSEFLNFAMAAFICLKASSYSPRGILSEVSIKKATASRCSLCVRWRLAKARIAHSSAVPLRQKVTLFRHFVVPRCVRRCIKISTGIAASRIKKRRRSEIKHYFKLLCSSI